MYLSLYSMFVAFSPFNCINLYGIQKPMLFYEHEIECWDSDHMKWTLGLAFPFLIIWIIGLPLALFIKLCMNVDLIQNQNEDFCKIYGVAFQSFHYSCRYWEFYSYSNKIIGVIGVVFMGRLTEGLIGLLFLLSVVILYRIQIHEQPNISKILIYK